MEKLISTTSSLHSALETLTEMEISERKLKQWKNRQITQPALTETQQNIDLFYRKLENQRREVRHYREISLWTKTFDKIVDMMARIVCVVYTRISQVSVHGRRFSVPTLVREKLVPYSGPIISTSKRPIVRFYSRRMDDKPKAVTTNRVFHAAAPRTVGASGLALRYANVILLVEEYLKSAAEITHDERESLYEMLPESLKAVVGAKLSRNMKRLEDSGVDASLAEGWREAMEEMMRWLVPVARDTVTWQMERNVEKVKMDAKAEQQKQQGERPAVLLVQTLHFADKEKTEAAIAELLVGLSCIFRFENRRFRD